MFLIKKAVFFKREKEKEVFESVRLAAAFCPMLNLFSWAKDVYHLKVAFFSFLFCCVLSWSECWLHMHPWPNLWLFCDNHELLMSCFICRATSLWWQWRITWLASPHCSASSMVTSSSWWTQRWIWREVSVLRCTSCISFVLAGLFICLLFIRLLVYQVEMVNILSFCV